MDTIHHGVDLAKYNMIEAKQPYLSFIGRIAPIRGTHLAIEIAKRADIPLNIAGEVQPAYRDYFEVKIKPHIMQKLRAETGDHYEYKPTGLPLHPRHEEEKPR